MYPEGQEILFVVEDAEYRQRSAAILRGEGFSVTEAAAGLAALRAIGAQRFALIVVAAHLPGSLDGRTTVRQARARQALAEGIVYRGLPCGEQASPAG